MFDHIRYPITTSFIEYKDYAVWENEQLENNRFIESKNYWVNQFKNDIPVLDMPTNYQRPAVQSFSGNKIYAKLNLEEFCLLIMTFVLPKR